MTRQQKWAKEALKRVQAYQGPDEKKYRTLCMRTPALIQQSGLVQALAFLRARDGEEGKRFCSDLAAVYAPEQAAKGDPGERLQTLAQSTDALLAYMTLTRDLIDVAIWMRRFAQAELKSDENE